MSNQCWSLHLMWLTLITTLFSAGNVLAEIPIAPVPAAVVAPAPSNPPSNPAVEDPKVDLKDGTTISEDQIIRLKALKATVANDGGSYVGDHLELNAALINVRRLEDLRPDAKKYCIPRGSEVRVKSTLADGMLAVRIQKLPEKLTEAEKKSDSDLVDQETKRYCYGEDNKEVEWVKAGYMYRIGIEQIAVTPVSRTGVTFGALVVPFKFYLGSDTALKTAPTVAPYVGYICGDGLGVTYTAALNGGLGVIPVNNSEDNSTTTEAVFSTSVGLLMTSEKNRDWSSGILIGKDWVGDSVKERDPVLNKLWLSLFIGFGF
ncbi:hypothetical protein [Nevskia ramosa]|uniref:hypothetical protein n=1 Tax=Nevskia ramosa TaxID=64002 RepID=UPI003D1182F7